MKKVWNLDKKMWQEKRSFLGIPYYRFSLRYFAKYGDEKIHYEYGFFPGKNIMTGPGPIHFKTKK